MILTGFVRRRQKGVIVALIALSTVVTTSVAWSYYSAQREAAAQARLAQVIHAFNQTVINKSGKEGFERVVVEARKIHDEYGASPAGRLAQYYLAISEESLGHTDRCVRNLEELILEGDPVMKPLAQLALGELYRNHGDTQKAMAIHKELEESGGYSRHGGHAGNRSRATGPSGGRPSS